MKKNLFLVIIFCFSIGLANAQRHFKTVPVRNLVVNSHHAVQKANAACDTLNLDAANDWSAYYYSYGAAGYVFGVSDLSAFGYNIQEDANYFDLSASDNNYISGGLAYFAFANSTEKADLDKEVLFKLYDDAGGAPGNLLGSTAVKLSRISEDVSLGNFTEFKFASPVALPASKKIYISIDHSNFEWNGTTHDTLAIVANGDDESPAAAYQYIDVNGGGTVWVPVNAFWSNGGNPLDVNLFVFPYASNDAQGCSSSLLPARTCFTDAFGYEWHLSYFKDGGKKYHGKGKVYLGTGAPWDVTEWGSFEHAFGTVELHAVNPNPDGCNQYVDSFVYTGNADVIRDGSVLYSGSGNWTSYCSGSELNTGTWDATGPCRRGDGKIAPNGPARHNSSLRIIVSPNPVKECATVSYNLTKQSQVNITIYDYMQQPVKIITGGMQSAGRHTYNWNVRGANGNQISIGLYRVVTVIDGRSYTNTIAVTK